MQKKGFTLTELLVVIAIIGLLGTLSTVSFGSTREKARMAKGMTHSGQVLRSLGNDLILRWDLDECIGSVASDSSGMNNQGTLSNVSWSTDTPSKKYCSLHIDTSAATSLITTTLSSTQYFSNISITSWFKTTSSGSGISPYYFDFRIVNGGYFQLCLNGCLQSNKKFNDGKWHFIVVTGDTKNVLVYIDGDNIPELTRPPDNGNISSFVLGSYNGSSNHINEFDDFRIYSRALSAKESMQLFAESLPQHLALE